MTDNVKIDLIRNLLVNYWENVTTSEDSALALISAIATVIDFKKED